MARTTGSRLSLLGILSILVGGAAFAAPYIPQMPLGAMPVAFAGIAVGAIALIASLTSGRSNSGIPVLGIVISLAALGLDSYQHDGVLSRWAHSRSQTPAPPPASAPPVVIPTYSGRKAESNNIFGIPTGGSDSPAITSTPAPSTTNPPRHPAAPSAAPAIPAVPSIPQRPTLSITDARAKLDSATAGVERTLANDPAYRQARAEVTAADARKKAALSTSGAGSPEVLETAQQLLDAKAKLQKLIAAAAAKDPAAQAAQRELAEAEKAARKK